MNELTQEQQSEMRRLKSYFPYRIVWAVINKAGEFAAYATSDKRAMNKELRAGNSVFQLQSN